MKIAENIDAKWTQFQEIIPQELINQLQINGFEKPTSIQSLTLSNYSHTNNFIIASQTGSGKTLSFSIPIITEILKAKDEQHESCQALIITPTRELALQIESQIKLISKPFYPIIQCCSIVGGFSSQKQERLLSKNPSIIISTPGRLWELIENQPNLFHNFTSLSMLCLDEADRMIQLGHFKELGSILQFIMKSQGEEFVTSEDKMAIESFLKQTSNNEDNNQEIEDILQNSASKSTKKKWKKVFLVSATFGAWFGDEKIKQNRRKKQTKYSKKKPKKTPNNNNDNEIQSKKLQFLMKQLKLTKLPLVLIGNQDQVDKQTLPENILVNTVFCPMESKLSNLTEIIKNEQQNGGIIIFCSRISSSRRLGDALTLLNYKNLTLHSKLQQRVRIQRWEKFLSQQYKILVCTDLGARGLDVPLGIVKTVIHWELPLNAETFIHRSGRTGRMGTQGNTYLLIEGQEKKQWKLLEKRTHVTSCKLNSIENSEIQNIWQQVQQNEKHKSIARETNSIKSKASILGVDEVSNLQQKSNKSQLSNKTKKIQKQKFKTRNIYFDQQEIQKYNQIFQEEKSKKNKGQLNSDTNKQRKIQKKLKQQRKKLLKQLIK